VYFDIHKTANPKSGLFTLLSALLLLPTLPLYEP